MFMISSVRSNPAKASVSWLPILLICTMGVIMKPSSTVNCTNSPLVSSPPTIWYAPIPMMPALAKPSSSVLMLLMNEVAVKLVFTLSNKRCTPRSKVRFSCSSAPKPLITRTPFRLSVNRPVTSALITPRVRKIGRILPKAFMATKAKKPTGTKVKIVMVGLIVINQTKEMRAVSVPPMSWTRPVPTKLRTPSTSLMMRLTKAPLFVLSKKLVGRERIFRWTWVRSWLMRSCASTLRSCVRM